MNERIAALIDKMNYSGLIYQAGDREMSVTGKDLEYFAELIVQECALTAGLMEHEGRKGIGAQILDNFGVKE